MAKTAEDYKKEMDYYSEKINRSKQLISNYETEEKNIMEIITRFDEKGYIKKIEKITNDMDKANPSLKNIGSYLTNVEIDGKPYDHGDFLNFNKDITGCIEKLNNIRDTLTNYINSCQKRIEELNRMVKLEAGQLNRYTESYNNAVSNYNKSLRDDSSQSSSSKINSERVSTNSSSSSSSTSYVGGTSTKLPGRIDTKSVRVID